MKTVCVLLFALICGVANAQDAPTCKLSDLFASPSFANGPDHSFIVTVSFRNLSDHTCRTNLQFPYFSPAPYQAPGMPPQTGHQPDTLGSHLLLAPGDSASIPYSWTTVSPVPGRPCIKLQFLGGPVLIAAPELLPPLCSDILSGGLTAAPPSDPSLQDLEISPPKETFLERESFDLEARQAVGSTTAIPALTTYETRARSDFYLLTRSPDGSSRFDEANAQVMPCFGVHPPVTTGSDGLPCLRFSSGSTSRLSGTGVFQFIAVRASNQPGGIVLHRSNTLAVTVLAQESLERTWGARVAGLAIALNMDKKTYVQGEDVPLHIAIENFSAQTAVHSWSPIWDADRAIFVEILDDRGHSLSNSMCGYGGLGDHGFGPKTPVILGTPIYIERACVLSATYRHYMLEPGSYTFVVTWTPLLDATPAPVPVRVQASAKVEIIP